MAASSLLLFHAERANAGELDRCLQQVEAPRSAPLQVGDPVLGEEEAPTTPELDRDAVVQRDLSPVADFHPETDRWTDRNNRIRVTFWQGAWVFSNELDIHHDYAIGLRLSWEVPGFIGIRIDSGVVPWSRLEVKVNGNNSRYMEGAVHSHTLSLGIFNPELSVDGLAFWAGFGGGLWIYSYQEEEIIDGSGIDGEFNDTNLAGNIFIELDYKVTDVLHVGLGLRQHVILAEHTDEGRFYSLNGVEQGGSGRNESILEDFALATEVTFNVSVLF